MLYLLLSIYAQHCQSWVPSEAKERDFLISVPHLRTRHRILLCLRYLSWISDYDSDLDIVWLQKKHSSEFLQIVFFSLVLMYVCV